MELSVYSDEAFMKEALKEAQKAFKKDEVPVGAIVVANNQVIARGHNLTETLNDVTAHAEMQVFTAASDFLGGKYLKDCKLYVTLEPCAMCAGASYWTQIDHIIFGAHDQKRGFLKEYPKLLHPKSTIKGGIMEEECSNLLKAFFKKKR